MIFNIKVKGRIATYIPGEEEAVCGNDGDQIKFELDEEWAAINPKTARFKYGTDHHDVEFTGDTCTVPYFEGVNKVYVGLYAGEKGAAEPRKSTTDTLIPYKYSSRCGASTPAPESGKNYTNEAKGAAAEAKAAAEEATAAAETIGELKGNVTMNSYRIDKLEREAAGKFVTVATNEGNLVEVPDDMLGRIVMVHILGSNSTTIMTGNGEETVPQPNYQREIFVYKERDRHIINLPPAEEMQDICPFIGYGKPKYSIVYGNSYFRDEMSFVSDNVSRYANFIFFEGGKAYYHQGCRYEENLPYTTVVDNVLCSEAGEPVLEIFYDSGLSYEKFIFGLTEPIITDISEYVRAETDANSPALSYKKGGKFDGYMYSDFYSSTFSAVYLGNDCFTEVVY